MKHIVNCLETSPTRWNGGYAPLVAYMFMAIFVIPPPVLADPLQAETISPVERVRNISRDVYRILVDVDGAIRGGTAFLISGQRIVATSNHVIEGGNSLRLAITTPNGEGRSIPLQVIATFPQKDLALLEAQDDLPGHPLPLATLAPEPPMELYAIGFPAAADPLGLPAREADEEAFYKPSVIKGYVSRVLTNRWTMTQLQHQTPIVGGYSGGPLLSESGTVMGISTSIHKEASGISFAVLAVDLVEFASACSISVNGIPAAAGPRIASPQPPFGAALDMVNTQSEQGPPESQENKFKFARADMLLRRGDISGSRLICEHLSETTHSAKAFFCLARTYDPEIFRKLGVIGITPDAATAERYYEQGRRVQQQNEALALPQRDQFSPRTGVCNESLCRLMDTSRGPLIVCQDKRIH